MFKWIKGFCSQSFYAFFRVGAFAQSTGNIEGNITTEKGQPAESVTILLHNEQQRYHDIADVKGHYIIKNIAPGS